MDAVALIHIQQALTQPEQLRRQARGPTAIQVRECLSSRPMLLASLMPNLRATASTLSLTVAMTSAKCLTRRTRSLLGLRERQRRWIVNRRDTKRLIRVAEELAAEVAHELYQAGSDEVKKNPILRSKHRVFMRCVRTIERIKRAEADASPVKEERDDVSP